LKKQLDKFSRGTSPLAVVPKDPGLARDSLDRPKMVAEVAFTEWTSDGSFQGLREDKNPKAVVREEPSGTKPKSETKSKPSR